jgi:hypothetical protein
MVVGCTKKKSKLQIYISQFQTEFLKKKNILQLVMFQNVLMDPKISKEKQINVFWNLCVISIFFYNLYVFPISYTCLHVISYKCKYVLFHLNMLKLFQEINLFFFFEIKLVLNNFFSFNI